MNFLQKTLRRIRKYFTRKNKKTLPKKRNKTIKGGKK